MNNKTIIEFDFRVIWRIMKISEGVMRLLDTQPHSLLLFMRVLLANQNRGNILNE